MSANKDALPEPWLRETLGEVPPVARSVLHAPELAREDLHKWCGALRAEQIHAQPARLPSVALQLRHIAGSIDRLLTDAEGGTLSETQVQALQNEKRPGGITEEILAMLDSAIARASGRVRALGSLDLSLPRVVGKKATAHHARRAAGSRCGAHATPRGPGHHHGEARFGRQRFADILFSRAHGASS